MKVFRQTKKDRKPRRTKGKSMTAKNTTTEKKPVIRRNSVIKAKPKGTANNAKKSEEEKFEIQNLISIGLRKCDTATEIRALIKERGFKLSVSTFYQYIKDIKKEWKQARVEGYEEHIEKQLAKLDLYENTLWKLFEDTKNEAIITQIIDKVWVRRNEILGITSSTINIQNNIQNNIEQTNIENKTEITKVEFQPVSEKFFGNFVIEVDGRGV